MHRVFSYHLPHQSSRAQSCTLFPCSRVLNLLTSDTRHRLSFTPCTLKIRVDSTEVTSKIVEAGKPELVKAPSPPFCCTCSNRSRQAVRVRFTVVFHHDVINREVRFQDPVGGLQACSSLPIRMMPLLHYFHSVDGCACLECALWS